MNRDCLISIIVPVYNSQIHLEKCLESIINQTYKNIEIIIVDDGSTDNSKSIINKYTQKCSNILSFEIPHLGVANARNYGIEKASGDYFLFVDSDDYIELDLIENLYKILNNKTTALDIIKYKMKIISNQRTIKFEGPVFDITKGEDAFNQLCFKDNMIDTPCLYLFRTRFYKEHNFKFMPDTYHEDFGLIPLIIAQATNVLSIDIYGYNYLQSDESIIRNSDYQKTLKKSTDLLIHYDNMINQIKKINLYDETISNLKQYYTNAIILFTENLEKKDKKSYICEIKNRKLVKNIKANNVKQFFKKIILNVDIRMYLFLNKYV